MLAHLFVAVISSIYGVDLESEQRIVPIARAEDLEGSGSKVYLRLNRPFSIPIRKELADGYLETVSTNEYQVGTTFELPISTLDNLSKGNFQDSLADPQFWRDTVPPRVFDRENQNYFVKVKVLEPGIFDKSGNVIVEPKESINYVAMPFLLTSQKLADGSMAPPPLENLSEQTTDYLKNRYEEIQRDRNAVLSREAIAKKALEEENLLGRPLDEDSVMMLSYNGGKACNGTLLRDQGNNANKKWELIDGNIRIVVARSDLSSTISVKNPRTGDTTPFTSVIVIENGKSEKGLVNFTELAKNNCLNVEEFYGEAVNYADCTQEELDILREKHVQMLENLNQMITNSIVSKTDFAFPVPAYSRIASFFGMRKLGNRPLKMHNGIDISAVRNAEVVAISDGVVMEESYPPERSGYGKVIMIEHSNGAVSVYAHNNSVSVTKGQSITKGQKIAAVGNSGTDSSGNLVSTGTHLHFEYRPQGLDGDPVDPLSIFGLDFASTSDK